MRKMIATSGTIQAMPRTDAWSLLNLLPNFELIAGRKDGNGMTTPYLQRLFQFHKGSIKTNNIKAYVVGVNKFQFHKGSIKTDLGEAHFVVADMFQFHKGSIKTWTGGLYCLSLHVFQFHKGSIKTVHAATGRDGERRFNSIKVRLRHRGQHAEIYAAEFQFHKGSIKTSGAYCI